MYKRFMVTVILMCEKIMFSNMQHAFEEEHTVQSVLHRFMVNIFHYGLIAWMHQDLNELNIILSDSFQCS